MLTIDQMIERRTALLADLENPEYDGDFDALETEVRQLADAIDAYNQRVQRANEARARLAGAEPAQQRTPPTPAPGPPGTPAPERRLSDHVIDSPALVAYRAGGYTGKVGFEIGRISTRALIDNAGTSGGAFQNPPRQTEVPLTNADRPPRLLDIIGQGETTDNTVEYVRDTTAAGGGAAAETAEGGLKPEAGYTWEVVSEPVRTIAHWVPITRQAAEDNAQLRTYIEGRLLYGVGFRVDGQILNGNGVAPNLRGILNVTGINAYTIVSPATEARVISIRKAITLVQQDEYAATGVALNPADWELVELSQDANGMFRVSPNVANSLAPRIWGLAVVPTTAIAAGIALVGDFRMGATWFDRMDPRVLVSDSHSDFFIRNQLVLLAEARGALAVWRPSAFCKVTFGGTT